MSDLLPVFECSDSAIVAVQPLVHFIEPAQDVLFQAGDIVSYVEDFTVESRDVFGYSGKPAAQFASHRIEAHHHCLVGRGESVENLLVVHRIV
jgi:hypothetical protein